MAILLHKISEAPVSANCLLLIPTLEALTNFDFSLLEINYITKSYSDKNKLIVINRFSHLVAIRLCNNSSESLEKLRNDGATLVKQLSTEKQTSIAILDYCSDDQQTLALAEGMMFASYQFTKYKSKQADLPSALLQIAVLSENVASSQLEELSNLMSSVSFARDLVNETPAALTAIDLANLAAKQASLFNIQSTTYHKSELIEMNFGGLLAVNRGSVDPPTFTVLEYKPQNCINTKPYVIVGKGVVYDTGGINLKTMPGGLDDMKCDMSGAAAVIGTLLAVAANQLPIHIIGLIPATDNRPGFNAYVPGDVIKMHSGATVEVMNTDAEGRLILADALSYAQQLNPELVIDLATLTGSAMVAIGSYGSVAMGTADSIINQQLTETGELAGERLTWFPFWEEYDELLKSEVADMKNIGGREAGAITAGKFLARFTNYPWIHLDIAGTAFLNKPYGYRAVGATGVGVRLLYHYFKSRCS